MIKNKLIKLSYEFYPRNVLGLEEKYNKSKEIRKLIMFCENSIKKDKNKWEIFKQTLVFNDNIKNIEKTTYFINQPSFVVQISDYNKGIYFNVYKSFLIPYFYVVKLNNEGTIEEINPNFIFGVDIKFFEKKLNCSLFPEELLEVTLRDVAFENITYGNFNLKNAFFNKSESIL